MYIVAIAWIYVVFMMSITEESVVAGVMTLVLYGILPLTIILYIMGTPQRKRRRAAQAAAEAQQMASSDLLVDRSGSDANMSTTPIAAVAAPTEHGAPAQLPPRS